jgi:hypothetical protein
MDSRLRNIFLKAATMGKRLLGKMWFRIGIVIGLLVLVVSLMLPYGLSYGVRSWCLAHGADEVSLDNLDFNAFTRTVSLENLNVVVAKETVLSLPQATLHFAWRPMWKKQLSLNQLKLRDATIVLQKTPMNIWRVGGIVVTDDKNRTTEKPWAYQLTGVELENSHIEYTSKQVSISLLIAKADLKFSSDPQAGLDVSGKVEANRIQSAFSHDDEVVQTGAERVLLSEFRVQRDGRISVAQASIHDMAIAQSVAGPTTGESRSSARLFETGKVTVQEFSLADLKHYSVKSIELDEARVNLRRDKSGRWLVPWVLRATPSTPIKPKKPAATVASFQIDQIRFDGSRVEIDDLAVTPAFKTEIILHHAALSGIDSGRPNMPMNLVMDGQLSKHSPFSVKGQFFPFLQPTDLKLTGQLKAIDLPPISPYVVDSMGYTVNAGHMEADVGIESKKGMLGGKTDLAFRDLQLAVKDADKAEKLAARITMPLDTAVSLLQDKDKRFSLRIDVSGNLGDPKFSFTDAVNQALLKSIQFASVSYLKWYFQPYGTLITIAQTAEKIAQIRLDPITYSPGADQTLEPIRRYLDKLVGLIQENARLTLKVCSRATADDLPYVGFSNERALELARRRAENVKDYLISRGDIAADRIIICAPQVDSGKEHQPRIELYL